MCEVKPVHSRLLNQAPDWHFGLWINNPESCRAKVHMFCCRGVDSTDKCVPFRLESRLWVSPDVEEVCIVQL